ncbi:protein of unknown function [Aminobacter niigataensis]|nr:protein of unknown function [Aminobacter niigataensis]
MVDARQINTLRCEAEPNNEAVAQALQSMQPQGTLWDRTSDLRARVAAFPPTELSADKELFDQLNDE